MRPALTSAKSGSPPSYAQPDDDGVSTLATTTTTRHTGASTATPLGSARRWTSDASNAPARISAKRAHDAKYAASALHIDAVNGAAAAKTVNRTASGTVIDRSRPSCGGPALRPRASSPHSASGHTR